MIKNKKIGFIGAGNMGEALIDGLLQSKVSKKDNIIAFDANEKRLTFVKNKYRIKTAENNIKLVKRSDVIIIAVKPQDIEYALKDMCWEITPKKLVISIAAGIPTSLIEGKLEKGIPVVRAMPNTPALVRAGITAICKGKSASAKDIEIAKKIFSAVGSVLIIREKLMNAITATSGSGPGYFMYLIEAFIVACMEMGMTWKMALEVVSQTALGSSKMLVDKKLNPAELREKVTSKGGTTEAAFKVFQKKKLTNAIVSGTLAAEKRAQQLAKGK